MRNFRTLTIWQESMAIVKKVYSLAELLPKEEKYGLRSQITRSSVSIASNIAEGCSRSSQIDFKRFLQIALGSSFELETQLIIIGELSLISTKEISETITNINKVQKMINNLITKLKANNQQPTANSQQPTANSQ
jgi:four helix bundle protein